MLRGMDSEGNLCGGGDDPNGTPNPIMYKGEPQMFAEWEAKLLAYLCGRCLEEGRYNGWTSEQGQPIGEDDMDISFGAAAWCPAPWATRSRWSTLPPGKCHGDDWGCDEKRYETITAGTKRAILKAIITEPPSGEAEEMERNLRTC